MWYYLQNLDKSEQISYSVQKQNFVTDFGIYLLQLRFCDALVQSYKTVAIDLVQSQQSSIQKP